MWRGIGIRHRRRRRHGDLSNDVYVTVTDHLKTDLGLQTFCVCLQTNVSYRWFANQCHGFANKHGNFMENPTFFCALFEILKSLACSIARDEA
jgi:hypothetical protein